MREDEREIEPSIIECVLVESKPIPHLITTARRLEENRERRRKVE